jgi:hypothetical protein
MIETELFHHTYRPIPFSHEFVGNYIVADPNSLLEKWLQRYGHNRSVAGYSPLSLQKDLHYHFLWQNHFGYIVGKGPSLAYLTKDYFQIINAPVIAITEAYVKVKSLNLPNPTFFLQCDTPQYCMVDDSDLKICTPKAARHYYMMKNLIVAEVDRHPLFLSVIYAIRIIKYFGCYNVKMLCFDALDGIYGHPHEVINTPNYPGLEESCKLHLASAKKVKEVLEIEYPHYHREMPCAF